MTYIFVYPFFIKTDDILPPFGGKTQHCDSVEENYFKLNISLQFMFKFLITECIMNVMILLL